MALCLFSILGCKKDNTLKSKELLAYIKTPIGQNNVQLAFSITPIAAIGDSTAKFLAGLTRETSVDVNLSFKVDPTLVASYNTVNKTSYELLPNENYQSLSAVTIRAGSTISSDSVRVKLKNVKKLTNDNGYILPIIIAELNTEDKGITLSTNFRTIYIIVKSSILNVDPSNTALTGANLDRTGWTATASGSYSSNTPDKILDGNNGSAWDSDGKIPSWLVVDMKSAKTVQGFSIVPNYVYQSDDFLEMDVLSSNDGITFKYLGQYKGTATSGASTAANPDIKTVRFYSPVTARYFKFNITKSSDGSYTGMGELYAK